LKQLNKWEYKESRTFVKQAGRYIMKKAVCVVLILTMAIFIINPLSSEANGGHGGGHWSGSGHGDWWVPLAIFGGAAVLSSIFYSAYNQPATVVIQEPPPVYVERSPSVTPSLAEKIFVYPRLGQSEELQAKDRYECHSWAVSQTKYDPTQPSVGNMPAAQVNQRYADYRRAEDACLDGRGYTVR
jgi:hypothetical protein